MPKNLLLQPLCPVAADDVDIFDTSAAQDFELVLKQRLALKLDHALRPIVGERAQPGALPGGQDDRSHGFAPR
ncbi:putative sugar nucleotidyltransferase [Halorhodospira halochloris]|uniref:Sugar nucleotidyltransferase n=1 Tax=Halorhodospira halochloris TaxID=1052 RepID=A0A0X8X7T1_HALHR|nr:putative sugar nucleotidyltransferase [Halorhodospira halochloris]